MTTRFGIVGTGRITRRLVAELQSTAGVEVVAIASRDASRARWFADQYGIAHAVVSYEALLARDDVDAVYVSLPPSLHTEWSIAAADQGKGVLCEKPLALCAADVERIASACQSKGVRWLDATAWLHHERTAALRKMIDAGKLGTIGHISAAVSFFRPFQSDDHRLRPELGGGCLLDLGWYGVGLTRFAAGCLPTSVYADAIFEEGVTVRLTAMLWFGPGVTATVSCGYDTATRKWCEVAGSHASFVCDDFTRPWAEKPARCWIHEASGKVEQIAFQGSQERAMIERFIGEESLEPYWRQATDTQRTLDALALSIERGERVTLEP